MVRGDINHDIAGVTTGADEPIQLVQSALCVLCQRLDGFGTEADACLARLFSIPDDDTADNVVIAFCILGRDLEAKVGKRQRMLSVRLEFADDLVRIENGKGTAALSVRVQDVQAEVLRRFRLVAAIRVPREIEFALGAGLVLAGGHFCWFDVPEPASGGAVRDWRPMLVDFAQAEHKIL